jgi:phosphoesterase RecJ-like protein
MPYFPKLTEGFRELVAGLRGSRVAVVGHARPDGDCIGSQVALARLLVRNGCDAVCVNVDAVPRRLSFLTAPEEFVSLEAAAGRQAVYVDCADALRPTRRVLEFLGQPVAQIDHHLSNADYATRWNLVDREAAATAEILAGLAYDSGTGDVAPFADALYAGILTDTGRFCFPSTSRRVFELAGRLVDDGASPAGVAGSVYEQETPGRLSLLQRFLSSLEFHGDGRVCLGTLAQGVFEETGTTAEDTEGLVDYARAVEGVQIGVLLEDRGNETKGSLRAKLPEARVDRIAARFGGGGHACAAGFRIALPAAELKPRLIAALENPEATPEPGKH